jgi:hypothetical protein
MKFSVRRLLALMGLFAAIGLVSNVEAKTIDVSSLDAGVFAEHRQYLVDGAGRLPPDSYEGPVQSRSYMPSSLTDLYKRGRRRALEELRGPNSSSLRTNQFALDLVKQDDFGAMLAVGAILVAQQLRRKHRSLKQSLITG